MLEWIRVKFGPVVIGGIIALIAFVFIASGVFSPSATRGIHEASVAGKVNGDSITMGEFNRAYERRIQFFQSMMGGGKLSDEQLKAFQVREGVFEELVRRKLLVQQASKQGVAPSEDEIRDKIQEIPAFQKDGKFSVEAYRQVLSANNYTPGGFEKMIREDLSSQYWEDFFRRRALASNSEIKQQFLLTADKRNLKYVLLTSEAGRRQVKVTDAEVDAFLADATKVNLLQQKFERGKDEEYKGKKFDDLKRELAREVVASQKTDEVRKANEEIAAKALPLLKAGKEGDAQLNALLKPYGVDVRSTGMINRTAGFLPGIGEAKDLLADAFALPSPIDPKAGGKAKQYNSAAWVLLAVVSESQKADLSQFEKERETLTRSLVARKERELFEEWIKGIRAKAKIVPNADVIGAAG